VDFFLAHQACAEALPDEEVVGWLEDTRRAGKIRAFGVATDFESLAPVLQLRPQLSRVVQFDDDLTRVGLFGTAAADDRAASEGIPSGDDRLLITYGFIGRAMVECRKRAPQLEKVADDELGGLLLRAAVLANPNGIVLMQSRSIRRIESNARAASHCDDDERVHHLARLLAAAP
jgi:aryl-alcohol dehydrogenase-like predicted oxidoreductase